jgi:3-oxoacyl-[acyl-carrier protein] reductase
VSGARAVDRGCSLVTGASRGIGAAVARGLAADGWPVALGYLSQAERADAVAESIRAEGGEAVTLCADIRAAGAGDELCARAERELGRPLLVLVNNAAVSSNRLSPRIDDERWQAVIDTNLSAAFRLTRRALRSMLKAGFGRVVNVTSAAVERPTAGQASYVSSKAGLVGLTKAMAVELASQSITVNAISPGLIETDLAADVPDDLAAAIPAGRFGTPAEVAACVSFLASDAASYVTGSVLTVDGGLSA